MFVRAGARLDRRRPRAAEGDPASGWRASAPPSGRTCSPTRRPGRCRSPRAISRGLPGRPRRRRGGGGGRARPGRPRRHAVAQPDRAVPAVLAAPRPARAGVPRLGGARRERRRHRQPRRSSPRRWRCARSGRGCSAIRLRLLQARARDGEDARGGARAADGGLGAGAGAGRGGRRAARGDDARRRRQRPSPGTGATTRRCRRRRSTTSTRRR